MRIALFIALKVLQISCDWVLIEQTFIVMVSVWFVAPADYGLLGENLAEYIVRICSSVKELHEIMLISLEFHLWQKKEEKDASRFPLCRRNTLFWHFQNEMFWFFILK